MMKTCIYCQQSQSRAAFAHSPNSHSPDKLGILCATCRSTLSPRDKARLETAHWRASNRDRARPNSAKSRKSLSRKSLNGLTSEELLSLPEEQSQRCAICEQLFGQKPFRVDRHPQTGTVRGLLCRSCNTAIVSLNRDAALLQKAIAYLLDPKGVSG